MAAWERVLFACIWIATDLAAAAGSGGLPRVTSGRYGIELDMRDGDGRLVPPGIYAYRLRAGSFMAQRKTVVIP